MKNKIIHTHYITIQQDHLDELNHVNNVVYLSFLQEAAIAHWYSLAPKEIIEEVRWIAKKHTIEYFKPCFLDEKIELVTWVESFTAISSLRKYRIMKGEVLVVEAETLWIALDSETMKPKRLDKAVTDLFFE